MWNGLFGLAAALGELRAQMGEHNQNDGGGDHDLSVDAAGGSFYNTTSDLACCALCDLPSGMFQAISSALHALGRQPPRPVGSLLWPGVQKAAIGVADRPLRLTLTSWIRWVSSSRRLIEKLKVHGASEAFPSLHQALRP